MVKDCYNFCRTFVKSAFVFLLMYSASGFAQNQPNCGADYTAVNGIVIIEAESLNVGTGWSKKSAVPGFLGNGYIEWENSNSFGTPGNGLTSTTIRITEPGKYRVQWRSRVGFGDHFTDFNDSFIRFDDASLFYGERADGSRRVFPRDRGHTPVPPDGFPNGAGGDGWFKMCIVEVLLTGLGLVLPVIMIIIWFL